MSDPHPHQAGSDEADPEKMSTPIGVARDLEAHAEEIDATVAPEPGEARRMADAVDPVDEPPTGHQPG